jgi:hypothetical protein
MGYIYVILRFRPLQAIESYTKVCVITTKFCYASKIWPQPLLKSGLIYQQDNAERKYAFEGSDTVQCL